MIHQIRPVDVIVSPETCPSVFQNRLVRSPLRDAQRCSVRASLYEKPFQLASVVKNYCGWHSTFWVPPFYNPSSGSVTVCGSERGVPSGRLPVDEFLDLEVQPTSFLRLVGPSPIPARSVQPQPLPSYSSTDWRVRAPALCGVVFVVRAPGARSRRACTLRVR